MKINIVAVGKIKEKFFVDAIDEYAKRLSKFCDFRIIEVDEFSQLENIQQKQAKEGEALLSKASGYLVALDGKGTVLSSDEMAKHMQAKMVSGVSEITFIIGGSNGLSKELKEKVNAVVSFGKITFPHQLFRVVLTEQIYRAFTIINHINYHK